MSHAPRGLLVRPFPLILKLFEPFQEQAERIVFEIHASKFVERKWMLAFIAKCSFMEKRNLLRVLVSLLHGDIDIHDSHEKLETSRDRKWGLPCSEHILLCSK